MRTSKIAALAALVTGLVWISSGLLSWGEVGLSADSTQVWWAGVGVFALTSALTGYTGVTNSPVWLRVIVFVCAGALGGSVVASFDTDLDQAPVAVAAAGGVVLLLGLIGLLVGWGRRRSEADGPEHRGGRRAAR